MHRMAGGQAAIAFEHECCPGRTPSSAIVINKHAQFKPHKVPLAAQYFPPSPP